MPTAAVNGIDIYYELAGDGPPLLFFNGSGATMANARLLIKPLLDHFEVLAHDQRGLGETSVPAGPYTMADYAADGAALAARVGWERYRVLGISFGGMVAQEHVVTWPARVERLVLLCTSPGGPEAASYPLHELAELDPRTRTERMITLLDTRFTPEWLATHDNDRALVEFFSARQAAQAAEDEAADGAAAAERRRGEAEQMGARSRHDVTGRLGAITCPTLVASGRYDGIAPPANGELIAAGIPGAELRLYEGGHMFIVQDPAAMADVVEFLT